MNAIAVVDRNWGIGHGGKLLVHLPGDLKYFKEKTVGKTLIMGRATLESLFMGRPLRDRETILLTRDRDYRADCTICHSLEDIFREVKSRNSAEVFVAGGAEVYKQLLPYCDRFYITKIDEAFPADRYFPDLDAQPEQFKIVWAGNKREENQVTYQFFEYRRKNNGESS